MLTNVFEYEYEYDEVYEYEYEEVYEYKEDEWCGVTALRLSHPTNSIG